MSLSIFPRRRAQVAFVSIACAWIGTFTFLGTSCQKPSPPIAPVDVVLTPVDAGTFVIAADASGASHDPARRCTMEIVAETIRTNPQCSLDERISAGPGELVYPCVGDGPAEISFAEHRFEGNVSQGALSLQLRTEVDWGDGCLWESNQSIMGPLVTDASKLSLYWTYMESPVSGTNCATACRASARIRGVDDDRIDDDRGP